jgi:hypothetical protein
VVVARARDALGAGEELWALDEDEDAVADELELVVPDDVVPDDVVPDDVVPDDVVPDDVVPDDVVPPAAACDAEAARPASAPVIATAADPTATVRRWTRRRICSRLVPGGSTAPRWRRAPGAAPACPGAGTPSGLDCMPTP